MKSSVSPPTAALCLIMVIGTLPSLSGQTLRLTAHVTSSSLAVPSPWHADLKPAENETVLVRQDVRTLAESGQKRELEKVVDLSVLRQASPYRQLALGGKLQKFQVATSSMQEGLEQLSAVYREAGTDLADCHALSISVEKRVKIEPSRVLEVVETEVGANPSCACEVVKAAIRGSDADAKLTLRIAETAISASPENLRIISQCAIAEQPECLPGMQRLLARLDPNTGTGYSAKSAKSAKDSKDSKGAEVASAVASAPTPPNPLNYPPPTPTPPPPIIPPVVTGTDPVGF